MPFRKFTSAEWKFITRLLFKTVYWLLFCSFTGCFYFYLPVNKLRFVKCLLNEDDDDDDGDHGDDDDN